MGWSLQQQMDELKIQPVFAMRVIPNDSPGQSLV
jgi:hypothetical protein